MQYSKSSPTGRVTGTTPNLQQMPRSSPEARMLAQAFLKLNLEERKSVAKRVALILKETYEVR